MVSAHSCLQTLTQPPLHRSSILDVAISCPFTRPSGPAARLNQAREDNGQPKPPPGESHDQSQPTVSGRTNASEVMARTRWNLKHRMLPASQRRTGRACRSVQGGLPNDSEELAHPLESFPSHPPLAISSAKAGPATASLTHRAKANAARSSEAEQTTGPRLDLGPTDRQS